MRTQMKRSALRLIACVVTIISAAASQKLSVVIVDRQISDTNYSYVVPGNLFTQSNSNGGCVGSGGTVNCSGATTITGSVMPPRVVSFNVRGATFTLQLPDGRLIVVNCESKFAERFAGPQGNRRSCRMPLVNEVQAEFDGDKAKLQWPVSIDGKKTESETYKILGILAKP